MLLPGRKGTGASDIVSKRENNSGGWNLNNSQVPSSSLLRRFNKGPGKTWVYAWHMEGDEKKIMASVQFHWANSWSFMNRALMSRRHIVTADLCH